MCCRQVIGDIMETYLLFCYADFRAGGGMNDFQGSFDTIWAARTHAESMDWFEVGRAHIIEVSMGIDGWQDGYHSGDEAVLYSLTLVMEGSRHGHHEEARIEWQERSYEYQGVGGK